MNIIKLGDIAYKFHHINSDLSNINITKSKLHALHAIVVGIDATLLDSLDDLSGTEYHIACCMHDIAQYLVYRIYVMTDERKVSK